LISIIDSFSGLLRKCVRFHTIFCKHMFRTKAISYLVKNVILYHSFGKSSIPIYLFILQHTLQLIVICLVFFHWFFCKTSNFYWMFAICLCIITCISEMLRRSPQWNFIGILLQNVMLYVSVHVCYAFYFIQKHIPYTTFNC
jgi:hypothetical protein